MGRAGPVLFSIFLRARQREVEVPAPSARIVASTGYEIAREISSLASNQLLDFRVQNLPKMLNPKSAALTEWDWALISKFFALNVKGEER